MPKSHIIFLCPFLRTFQMILPRSPPCFPAQMPLHKHLVYILICVPFSGLMYRICAFSKSHCSHAIILSYNNVIPPAKIYKRKINGIRSCPDNLHFTVIRIQHMVGIAQNLCQSALSSKIRLITVIPQQLSCGLQQIFPICYYYIPTIRCTVIL